MCLGMGPRTAVVGDLKESSFLKYWGGFAAKCYHHDHSSTMIVGQQEMLTSPFLKLTFHS